MSALTITIYGREYKIACGEGEEKRVLALAAEMDKRVRQLAGGSEKAQESLLLVMLALLMADELNDAKRHAAELEEKIATLSRTLPREKALEMETAVARMLETIAARVEHIAEQVEVG